VLSPKGKSGWHQFWLMKKITVTLAEGGYLLLRETMSTKSIINFIKATTNDMARKIITIASYINMGYHLIRSLSQNCHGTNDLQKSF